MPSRTFLIWISGLFASCSFKFFTVLGSKSNLLTKFLSPVSLVFSKYSNLESITALGCLPYILLLSKTSGGNAVNLPSFILSITAKSSAFVIPLPFFKRLVRVLCSWNSFKTLRTVRWGLEPFDWISRA